jgi:transcription elongation factor Elf1
MEPSFKCPHCGKQTFGVVSTRLSSDVICPNCSKEGLVCIMQEQKIDRIVNVGGGMFQKKPSND